VCVVCAEKYVSVCAEKYVCGVCRDICECVCRDMKTVRGSESLCVVCVCVFVVNFFPLCEREREVSNHSPSWLLVCQSDSFNDSRV